jgi:hypothetical protein
MANVKQITLDEAVVVPRGLFSRLIWPALRWTVKTSVSWVEIPKGSHKKGAPYATSMTEIGGE